MEDIDERSFARLFFLLFSPGTEREYGKNGEGRERERGRGEVGQREEKIETGIRG